MFTWNSSAVYDLFEWRPRLQGSVGCRRHRDSARFPLEPPSLARPLGERWRRKGSALPLGGPERARHRCRHVDSG